MIKQINRILKLVGFNLVRAKRRKGVRWHGRLVVSTCEDPTPLLLALTEVADPKSFSVGPNPGKTHYVGDDCPGGHRGCFDVVGYKAKVAVVNPDAAFVPVDIGVGQDERPRHCEVADGAPAPNWETAGGTTPEQNEARFNEPK